MRDTGWFTQKDNTLVKVITLRYSLNQNFDLVLEPRHFTVPVIRWEKGWYIPAAVTGYFTGVGVRNTKRNWFSQTTLYYAREKLQLDIPGSDTVSNLGYFGGVSGGYSIVVNKYISVPCTVTWIFLISKLPFSMDGITDLPMEGDLLSHLGL